MARRLLLLLACALPFSLALACGDDDDDSDNGTATVANGGGNGSDEDYLRAICVGTSNFSNALLSAGSVDDIRQVVQDFADEMRGLDPPSDLVEYNQAFVAYLEAAAEGDPTSLVTTAPPEPSDDVRRRMQNLEPTIDECRDPTFFSRDETEDGPGGSDATPGGGN